MGREFYKIAMVGLGSIGRRHLKNMVSILDNRNLSYSVDLIRSGKGAALEATVSELVHKVYFESEAVPDDYDVVFVTNPTHLHYETVKRFLRKTRHMFIEKPVFDSANLDLDVLPFRDDGVYYVACPLRYTKVIQYLKNEVNLEQVYCARSICSSYLPEWRPGEDYRRTYSAHRSQGGGVSIDLIHEWDYLCYLFGSPVEVLNLKGKVSDLQIDSEDLSLYVARYERMMAEVHLDYFGRQPIREVQLFMKEDTLIGDLISGEVRLLKSGRTISLREDRNAFQLKELEHFFNIVEGKAENDNDLLRAVEVLKISKGEL
ncbi:Gfo/Idh/MocA family protein [Anaeromusa acidaminophila]|uniref:Gfo/Idh/MocA family protein n=1 Tax=Anaeromusa acidaminophila TaxID=81464 RepID=UPI0004758B98|nr:Gfo/Idh/MocA family oxidoreductase [Anaeromusa acidaminophila]